MTDDPANGPRRGLTLAQYIEAAVAAHPERAALLEQAMAEFKTEFLTELEDTAADDIQDQVSTCNYAKT